MIDEIFACPVRKYHVTNDRITGWATTLYNDERDKRSSPLKIDVTNVDGYYMPLYADVLEEFIKDLGLGETHHGIISHAIFCGLEKGDSLSPCITLPSHYTITHYIKGNSADVFYHPAKHLVSLFSPNIDEWTSAMSLYVNEGDIVIHPSYLEYSTPQVDKQRLSFTFLMDLEPKE